MKDLPPEIGNYKILKKIGSGGMGEIFLAYDPVCKREIALKCIRSDIKITDKVRQQFLNEAILTSQLIHPGIIPIYSIVAEENLVFFTMPFIEGKMLKDLFAEGIQKEQDESPSDPSSSVPAFSYMFLQICSAVAYAHSKGIIHRDLKPSNIIVGSNHEIRIIDWGLIKVVEEASENEKDPEREGKISGTVIYLAPELTLGQPPSYQTEIYSLGLILYQMLTLRYPFHRSNISQYSDSMQKEILIDPSKVAPHRKIPPILSNIALKCLACMPENRYLTVQEIIYDLECFLEARSDWIKYAELHLDDAFKWNSYRKIQFAEFEEASLFISKASFIDHIKLETEVIIEGRGIGFILNAEDPKNADCVWLSSDPQSATKIFRNQKLVMECPDVILQKGERYRIRIEKVRNNLYVYLNNILQFTYMSYLPQIGAHIGVLEVDTSYGIHLIKIFVEAKNLQGNLLATADAFLAYKDYDKALNEYRCAAQSLAGTGEGREALFCAGIVLLEDARNCMNVAMCKTQIEAALQEFAKLHGTPGAPLEYLGRVLVYEWLCDREKEIDAFKYALKNFSHHPLIGALEDQLIYRIRFCNQNNSAEFYRFALLAVRYLPFERIQPLLPIVKQKLEPVYFLDDIDVSIGKFQRTAACVELAFYLADPYTVAEMIDEVLKFPPSHLQLVESALIGLIELDAGELAQQKLDGLLQMQLDVQAVAHFGWIHQLICASKGNFEELPAALLAELPKKLERQHMHFVICLLNQAQKYHKNTFIRDTIYQLIQFYLTEEQKSQLANYNNSN
jgi:eukaryotic-like serine/threonine-protein kinase